MQSCVITLETRCALTAAVSLLHSRVCAGPTHASAVRAPLDQLSADSNQPTPQTSARTLGQD